VRPPEVSDVKPNDFKVRAGELDAFIGELLAKYRTPPPKPAPP